MFVVAEKKQYHVIFITIEKYLRVRMELAHIKTLSKVRLTTTTQTYEGLLMPREGEYVILKLSSGYNIGIHQEKIEDVLVLNEPVQRQEQSSYHIIQDKSLPIVKLLHTGGTIASKVDYRTGAVVAAFDPSEILSMFPELSKIAYLESELLENMQSDDFRFSHFNKIAAAIYKAAKKGIQNFIVTSGTDFLHYLSAALSFILKDVSVGVLVVGSQRSSDRGSTDAAMNLICAAQFLATTSFTGVAVCMHATQSDDICNIIAGTRVRKMHSSRRDAFKAINDEPLATVDYRTKKVLLHEELFQRHKTKIPSTIPLFKENIRVGLLYSRPQLFEEELAMYDSYDGLVLAGSGLGHFPITKVDESCKEHEQLRKTLALLAKKIPVVMSVQTIYGRVHMNVYSPGRVLQELGVIGQGLTMTPETSYIKLAWLLSNHTPKEAKALFMKDIVGELSNNSSNKQ